MNRAMTLPARYVPQQALMPMLRAVLSDDYIEIGIVQADLIADA